MSQQGWYPDPGGQAGMFRYWDGQSWSEVVSPTPQAGPPAPQTAPGQFGGPSGWDPTRPISAQAGYGTYDPSQPSVYDPSAPFADKPRSSPTPWILLGVGVLVVALVIWFVVGQLGTIGGGGASDDPTYVPGDVCPKISAKSERADHPNDGRVYGGALSYPKLSFPWGAVTTEEFRVPFGRDTASQSITIHSNFEPGVDWVAAVVVGELYAGDGFFEPEEASKIVNRCIFGAFYGDAVVTPETLKTESYTVDGYEGWITETNLSFSIPNLPTTSELAIVIIVKTSSLSSSIFYASIPNDAMQYEPSVRDAIADLKVEPI
ncbi:MAG: DUF2510 domain-containing protein [Propionibacteriaceae bacterium]|jgi:hypothetical protein|nr:DUF2510 domain-containing protein [Propionibacteriaceae bacterium]